MPSWGSALPGNSTSPISDLQSPIPNPRSPIPNPPQKKGQTGALKPGLAVPRRQIPFQKDFSQNPSKSAYCSARCIFKRACPKRSEDRADMDIAGTDFQCFPGIIANQQVALP